MSLEPIILDQVQSGDDGNREIRIGEYHIAPKGIAGRDIPLAGTNLSYLRSAWPKVEAQFPRVSFSPVTDTAVNIGATGSKRICAGNNGLVLAVAYAANNATSVRRSTDYGVTWSAVTSTATAPYTSALVQDVKFNPTTGTFLLVRATTNNYSIDRSTDNGATWTQVRTAGLSNAHLHGQIMALTWVSGSTWVAAIRSTAVTDEIISYKSTDDGVTWTAGTQTTAGSSGFYVYQVRVGYSGTTYYLFFINDNGTTFSNHYLTSTDGLTWTSRFSTNNAPVAYGGRVGEMMPLEGGDMALPYAKTHVADGAVGIMRLRPTSPASGGGSDVYFYSQINSNSPYGMLGYAFMVPDNQIIVMSSSDANSLVFSRYYRTENAATGEVLFTSHTSYAGSVGGSVFSNGNLNMVWSALTAPEWTFCVNPERTKVYALRASSGLLYIIDLTVGADRFEVPYTAPNYTAGSSMFAGFSGSPNDSHVWMQPFLRGA
jgi:hypothetical protein